MTVRDRFGDLVRSSAFAEGAGLSTACLLIAAESRGGLEGAALDTFLDHHEAQLDDLGRQVALNPHDPRAALGGFHGDSACYLSLESSLLPDVLRSQRGLPILLSVVWLEACRRAGVPADGVPFPGHYIVRIGGSGGRLVDPFAGGAPSARVSEDPPIASNPQTVDRILHNIRAWAGDGSRAGTRLWAVELSLLLPTPMVSLYRERAEALAKLGQFALAATAYEDYAQMAADYLPADAERALELSKLMRARLN